MIGTRASNQVQSRRDRPPVLLISCSSLRSAPTVVINTDRTYELDAWKALVAPQRLDREQSTCNRFGLLALPHDPLMEVECGCEASIVTLPRIHDPQLRAACLLGCSARTRNPDHFSNDYTRRFLAQNRVELVEPRAFRREVTEDRQKAGDDLPWHNDAVIFVPAAARHRCLAPVASSGTSTVLILRQKSLGPAREAYKGHRVLAPVQCLRARTAPASAQAHLFICAGGKARFP